MRKQNFLIHPLLIMGVFLISASSCEKGQEPFKEKTGTFIDARDNNEYEWVRIGDQVWMAENLAYLPSVSPSEEESRTEPYYYVYDYQGTNVNEAKATPTFQTFGVLYNWPAACIACPSGWHLSTDEEWKTLEMYLGMSQEEADDMGSRGTDEGDKLKEPGTTYWETSNADTTNEIGFAALPSGFRTYYGGIFGSLGRSGFWWSFSELDQAFDYYSWSRTLSCNHSITRNRFKKESGYSVRCLRD